MKILITGGAGFIGSHIVKRCLNEGHKVRVIDNFSTGNMKNIEGIKGQIQIVKGDITNSEDVQEAMIGIDAVVHCAAQISVQKSIADPIETMEINAKGTLNLLEACVEAGVKKFINSSSAAIYGDNTNLPLKESEPSKPLSPYGKSKLKAEKYCKEFAKKYDMDTINLRFFNVYGPNQDPKSPYSGVISKFIYAMLNGDRPVVFGDGRQTRDFIFIDDLVKITMLVLNKDGLKGELFNVANGKQISILTMISVINQVTGNVIRPVFEDEKKGDIKFSCADIEKVKTLLKYEPMFSFEEGIKKTIDYLS